MDNNSLCDLLRDRRIQLGYSLEYTSEISRIVCDRSGTGFIKVK